ncbi:F-box only protein 33 [Osmerus mordax]|uniref:F-box only protein 33 n=1 Tax=Osmerus mordax TaxID=8014 RepID=UPI003510B12E
MALCRNVGAMALPSELIVHIFSFLSDRDKLRASSVCSRWRECLFYPTLWTELKLRVGGCSNSGGSVSEETSRLEFLTRKFGSFVRELEFSPVLALDEVEDRMEAPTGTNPQFSDPWKYAMTTYLDQVLCVLSSIRNNRNLQRLSLYGDTCILQEEVFTDRSYLNQVDQGCKKIKEIQQLFEEVLSNSRQIKWLSSAFMLGMLTPSSLASLSNPSADSLEHLSLLDNQLPPLAPPCELARLTHLQSLGLDFCDFTSEMCRLLAAPDRVPLHRLSLLLNGDAPEAKPLEGIASEEDWKGLVRHTSNLRVFMMGLEVGTQVLLQALKPSMPLERLHLDCYCTLVSEEALELISQQYNQTLSHFLLTRDNGSFPDLGMNRNEDPLVLLAWRCVHLTVLVIHGYTVWSHNLVAISRLRGSNLKLLAVSEESIDFDPDQSVCMEGDPVHNLVKEVSLGLGRVWHPISDISGGLTDTTLHFHSQLQAFSTGM